MRTKVLQRRENTCYLEAGGRGCGEVVEEEVGGVVWKFRRGNVRGKREENHKLGEMLYFKFCGIRKPEEILLLLRS